MKKRAHIMVTGMVQGIFFRDFAVKSAKKLGLTGWVRNLPDGRVEVMVEGKKEDIEVLIKSLWTGPIGSKVDDMRISWEKHLNEFKDFLRLETP